MVVKNEQQDQTNCGVENERPHTTATAKSFSCELCSKSFSKKPPTIPKIKTTKLKPAIKAVKKDSLDSLPDMAGIDPFDRAKTPDPKAPGTLVYGLKEVENSKTKSFKAIEKYYASKSAKNIGHEDY